MGPALWRCRTRRIDHPTAAAFVAIDFETADYGRDSACAVGIVRVADGRIERRVHYLIRPPRRDFVFSDLHGITWADVADAPSFQDLWPVLRQELDGVQFVAAHNAAFDRSVLAACCAAASVPAPAHEFRCTMHMARAVWSIFPTRLPDVCRRLDLALHHHDPMSDAEACANVVLTSFKCEGCPKARGCYPARAKCVKS